MLYGVVPCRVSNDVPFGCPNLRVLFLATRCMIDDCSMFCEASRATSNTPHERQLKTILPCSEAWYSPISTLTAGATHDNTALTCPTCCNKPSRRVVCLYTDATSPYCGRRLEANGSMPPAQIYPNRFLCRYDITTPAYLGPSTPIKLKTDLQAWKTAPAYTLFPNLARKLQEF